MAVWTIRGAKAVPLDLVLLIDASDSMERYDPEGGRGLLVSAIIDDLRSLDREQGSQERLAVAWFGATIGSSIPMLPVDEVQISEQPRLPFTDFVPAFEFALSEFQRPPSDQGRRRAMVIITDARPQKSGDIFTLGAQSRYFAAKSLLSTKTRQLESLGVEILLVGIGSQAIKYEPLWRSVLARGDVLLAGSNPTRRQLAAISEFISRPKRLHATTAATTESTTGSSNSEVVPLAASFAIALVVAIFSTALLALLWVSTTLERLASVKDVELLYQRANLLLMDGNKSEGVKTLLEAVEKLDIAASGERQRNRSQYSKLFKMLLSQISDRDRRRSILASQMNSSFSSDKIEALALAVFEFWLMKPDLFLEEFYTIQTWRNGGDMVEIIGRLEPNHFETYNQLNVISIINLAKVASEFRQLGEGKHRYEIGA